jgi:ankyrin repeat protein
VTDDEIRLAIQNLPKDLVETYARILTKIWRSPGGNRKFATAEQIFKWVIFARLPLTVDELNEAVAIKRGCDSLDMNNIPPNDKHRLLRSCGNLLTVDRNDETVRLAHHSFEKFLLSAHPPSATYGPIRLKQLEAGVDIGILCITYLGFRDFETQIVKRESTVLAANASTINSNLWRQIPYGNAVTRLISATRGSSPLAEREDLYIRLAGYRSPRHWSETFPQKYVLLDYIASSWPWHNAQFGESTISGQMWARFKDLTFRREFIFDARPWEAMQYGATNVIKSLPHLSLLRWTIDQGLLSFLSLLFGYNCNIMFKGCLEFQTFQAYHSHEMKNGINLLVRASQRNHNETFDFLLDFVLLLNGEPWPVTSEPELIFQVASISNIKFRKLIRRVGTSGVQSVLNRAIQERNVVAVRNLLSFAEKENNLPNLSFLAYFSNKVTPLELAAMTGDVEIIGLLCLKGRPGDSFEKAAKIVIDRDHHEVFRTLVAWQVAYRFDFEPKPRTPLECFILSASAKQLQNSKRSLRKLLTSLPSEGYLGTDDPMIGLCRLAKISVRLVTPSTDYLYNRMADIYARKLGLSKPGGIQAASSFRSLSHPERQGLLPPLQILHGCDNQDMSMLAGLLQEHQVVGVSGYSLKDGLIKPFYGE